jgi:hypothetical protein
LVISPASPASWKKEAPKSPPPGEVDEPFGEVWRSMSHIRAVLIEMVLRGKFCKLEVGLGAKAE